MSANQLLLLKDVEDLGRSGQVVKVKPGYARNFLLPRGFAVIADKGTLRMQERLQKEREVRALEDKKESEEIAKRLEVVTLTEIVKVDSEGHMYGSVSALDIIRLLEEQANIKVTKKTVQLKHPLKRTGVFTVDLKLPEEVMTQVTLKIVSEDGQAPTLSEEAASIKTEEE